MGAPAYNNTLSSGMLVRLFNNEEIEKCSIGAAMIGRGSFGTCYFAKLGPLQVCKKVHHSEPKMIGYFYNEVTMLQNLCHENLPILFGACVQEHHPKCILMSMHSFTNSGDVLNVEDALRRKDSELPAAFSITDWKCILHGTLSALEYLHLNTILHNDIKANNVVIEKILHTPDSCRPVLIDFGKACYVKDLLAIHLNTILHNDIKANNVVIEKILHTPDSCRPVLIDFGKACYVKDARTYELSIQQEGS